MSLSQTEIDRLRRSLLAWYQHQGRDLPWRNIRDPYAIWVAEIMLQQTQVKTVIPYYQRWLSQFPTVEALAIADLQQVLKVWISVQRFVYRKPQTVRNVPGIPIVRLIYSIYNSKFPCVKPLLLYPIKLSALPSFGTNRDKF
ncbi:MAG: hypothetical protein WAN66_11800 [Limnoraphis robusta]|uniref:hypothetical protein n=1 Tax=Limnoraphis robusta TaxID=1118279 RepID=UPI0019108A7B|nr:hypothetical protein [Limnoraphis robusta]